MNLPHNIIQSIFWGQIKGNGGKLGSLYYFPVEKQDRGKIKCFTTPLEIIQVKHCSITKECKFSQNIVETGAAMLNLNNKRDDTNYKLVKYKRELNS